MFKKRLGGNTPSYFTATLTSTVLVFLVLCSFHWLAGATIYMPMVTASRIARYGIGLYAEDFMLVAFGLLVVHTVAARWTLVGYWLTVAMLVCLTLVRFVQYQALVSSGEYLTPDAFEHADLAYLMVTPDLIIQSGVLLVLLVGLALGLRKLYHRAGREVCGTRAERVRVGWGAAIGFAMVWLVFYGTLSTTRKASWVQNFAIDTRSPDRALVESLLDSWFPPAAPSTLTTLTPEDAALLRGYGFQIQPHKRYPLQKARIFEEAVPRAANEFDGQPNVIVFFFEGLSSRFLEQRFSDGTELTPHFNRFASTSLQATQYYNHTTPTVLGLLGQLCSFYPVTSHETWLQATAAHRTRLGCLPEILGDQGYGTTYLGHGQPRFTRIGDVLKETGFGEQIHGDELSRRLLGKEPKGYDRTDHEVLEAAWKWLNKKGDATGPFFLAISTMDFHMPFKLPKDAPGSPEAGLPSMLQILHSTDHAFGLFMERLKSSSWARNTIVVVTADHAVLPHKQMQQFLPPANDYRRSVYDRIPLMIASPVHSLPKRVEHLANGSDLTPTLLHLLGINVPNAFMGLSLFAPHPRRAGLFASHANLNAVLDFSITPYTGHEFNMAKAPGENEPETVKLYRRWFRWHQGLVFNDRIFQ